MMNKQRLGYIIKLMLTMIVALMLGKILGCREYHLNRKNINKVELLTREVVLEYDSTHHIESVDFRENGIVASYPRILTGGSATQLEDWNRIIKEDFDKIIQIYSFQPFPQPMPPTDVVPIMLTLSYDVKGNTDAWLSILYHADYNSIYSAHPSNLVYTSNIDKRTSRRLRLSDIVDLNEAFVKEFRSWRQKDNPQSTDEIRNAVNVYINNISDEELLTGFRLADQIGSGNTWGIYSYLTKDRVGISIEVPNYAGDHAEFEQEMTMLEQYLKPEFSEPVQ